MSLIFALKNIFGNKNGNQTPRSINKSIGNIIENRALPPRSIYQLPSSLIKNSSSVQKLDDIFLETSIPGISLKIESTIEVSGVIKPTEAEVQFCYDQIAFHFESQPSKLNQNKIPNKKNISLDEIYSDANFKNEIDSTPLAYSRLIKLLRAKIRENKKNNINNEIYLKALINAVYIADCADEFELRCTYFESKFSVVYKNILLSKNSIKLLKNLDFDYQKTGYSLFKSFSKTDVKLIVKNYGEPQIHTSPAKLIADLKNIDVNLYFKEEAIKRKLNIENTVKFHIQMMLGYHKSYYERVKGKSSQANEYQNYLSEAVSVTSGHFIIADLETSGLDPKNNEIIEIGAVLSNSSFEIVDKFVVLIKPINQISSEITNLTGLTNDELQKDGCEINSAFMKFVEFTGVYPVFFHNARFDSAFLRVISQSTGVRFENSIYDTLTMSRKVFPGLESYRLNELARYLGLIEPKHRSIDDAICTLHLLKAIKTKFDPFK